MNYFTELNAVNVNENTEKKGGLTYLSWAFAWGEIKKLHPSAYYTIYENANGWNYHTDGKTCWVKTGVTIIVEDKTIEHIEYLPVMDYKNNSIPADKVTSFDVNKAIQRSLTKACARHGLGLYIYAGEDLPEEEAKNKESQSREEEKPNPSDRKARIEALCKHHGITMQTFGEYLKVLQDEGKVANKTTAKMTEAEFGVLISLVHSGLNASKSA